MTVRRAIHAALFALLVGFAASAPAPDPVTYDFVLAGGRVVDGTGVPWGRADVGLRGDRIAAIGDLSGASARARIDARGLVVCPGFIDLLGQSELYLLADGRDASKILQGVTTEITGEGTAVAPMNARMWRLYSAGTPLEGRPCPWTTLDGYFAAFERARPAVNLGTFVGLGGVRDSVIGRTDRAATPAELERMRRLVAEAMEQGALGASAALQYVPDRFLRTDELIALTREAARRGGVFFVHQRSEGNRIFASLDEEFTIAERAPVAVEIWHLKTAYRANWGRMPEVLRRIERARERGLDVTADAYPYARAMNGLDACLPVWAREGELAQELARLRDPTLRARIRRELADSAAAGWENQWYGSGGADGVMLVAATAPEVKRYVGLSFAEIGRRRNEDPRDAVMDLVLADSARSYCVTSIMREDDVRSALADPRVSVCTDAQGLATDGPLATYGNHPRAFGTFPRILGRYVREERLLRLEEAIRKMTSQPAHRVGLADRGILRPGMAADVVAFDPAAIRDVATYENPRQYAIGIRHVFVNGRPVVRDGRITDERPGRVLRGPGWKARPGSD